MKINLSLYLTRTNNVIYCCLNCIEKENELDLTLKEPALLFSQQSSQRHIHFHGTFKKKSNHTSLLRVLPFIIIFSGLSRRLAM